jgi:hypothetical protein
MTRTKQKLIKVENEIYKMLTENTGASFLDSGSAYGRHWQRNSKKTLKDFENEPEVDFELEEDGSVDYTISVYHFLKSRLDDPDDICIKFNTLQDNDKNQEYAKHDTYNLYGISVDGWNYLKTVLQENTENTENYCSLSKWTNTYNYDSNLSQILQFTTLQINYKNYVLLQIHGGCDARGGYTDAKLFPITGSVEEGWFAHEGVYGSVNGISVSNCYDGYSLRYEPQCSDDDPKNWLQDREVYCNPGVKNHDIKLYLECF